MVQTNLFKLKIAIPSKVCFDGEVGIVEICSAHGYMAVMTKHIPIVANVVPSYLYIKLPNGSKKIGIVNNGIFSFNNNQMLIVSDFFEFTDNLDINLIDQRNKHIMETIDTNLMDESQRNEVETRINITTARLKELAKR